MNKKLMKLHQISERIWILASMAAQSAAALGNDGRGFAVVAEETRSMAGRMSYAVEDIGVEGKYDEETINKIFSDLTAQLSLLAINSGIQAYQLNEKGKQAAVCAEDIRNLAVEIAVLFSGEKPNKGIGETINPWPKTPLTTINQQYCFLLFTIAGISIKENLYNIREIIANFEAPSVDHVMLRGKKLPVINGAKMLGKPSDESVFIILHTPWAEHDKTYAVAANSYGICCNPIGASVAPPDSMPLAKYVRECWENENGEPYYFIDWGKMI